MTTIIATQTGMWSDTKVVYAVNNFRTPKLFEIGDSVFGISGDLSNCLKFIKARQEGVEPKLTKDDFDILEKNKDGIFLWTKEMVPLKITDEYYSVGTGGHFAIGAMDMGATPVEAIRVAARRDPSTNDEIDCIIK